MSPARNRLGYCPHQEQARLLSPTRNRLGYCPHQEQARLLSRQEQARLLSRQEQARLLSETIAVVEQRTGNMLFCNLFCILRASCLMLEIKEFRCYEMKTETTRRLPVQYI